MSKAETSPSHLIHRSSLKITTFSYANEGPPISQTPTARQINFSYKSESPALKRDSLNQQSLKHECCKLKHSFSPDPYIQKFEKISSRLEKLLDEVHAKYNIVRSSTWKSTSPKNAKLMKNFESFEAEKLKILEKTSLDATLINTFKTENNNLNRKGLNKHVIRSKMFEGTSRWLSGSPR